MNFCGKCGIEQDATDHFCRQCGKSFHPNSINKKPTSPKNFVFTQNKVDVQAHQDHLAYHQAIGRIQNYIFFILLIALIIFSQFLSHLFINSKLELMSPVIGFIGAIFCFIILSSFNIPRRIAHLLYKPSYPYTGYSIQYVYDQLESAKLRNGDHRCIYCGNNRLYRKGIYASDECTVNCTKCKTFLYYD